MTKMSPYPMGVATEHKCTTTIITKLLLRYDALVVPASTVTLLTFRSLCSVITDDAFAPQA